MCYEFDFHSWSAYYGWTCSVDIERALPLGRIHDYVNFGMIIVEYVLLLIILQIQVCSENLCAHEQKRAGQRVG